jgi:hypothetical protein
MAASDYAPIFFKNRLHLAGRPQMSTRPKFGLAWFGRRCPGLVRTHPGLRKVRPDIGTTPAASQGQLIPSWPF